MFTSTRLLYIASAAVCGIAAGGYVAWAIVSRYGFVAGLNDRAQLDTDILVVCARRVHCWPSRWAPLLACSVPGWAIAS